MSLVRVDGIVSGGMICKLEGVAENRKLYIISFGVYLHHRRRGVGAAMMKRVLAWCEREQVSTISLHVHTANEDALAFYKSFDFKVRN